MQELFYVGKRISTGEKVLVLMDDFDELPKEKATQSLLDMGVEVDTNKIVVRSGTVISSVRLCKSYNLNEQQKCK